MSCQPSTTLGEPEDMASATRRMAPDLWSHTGFEKGRGEMRHSVKRHDHDTLLVYRPRSNSTDAHRMFILP